MINISIKFNYSKLKGRIIEKYGSFSAFSEVLGFSKQALSKKLNCKIRFTESDILTIIDKLDIPVDEIGIYFFTKEV